MQSEKNTINICLFFYQLKCYPLPTVLKIQIKRGKHKTLSNTFKSKVKQKGGSKQEGTPTIPDQLGWKWKFTTSDGSMLANSDLGDPNITELYACIR